MSQNEIDETDHSNPEFWNGADESIGVAAVTALNQQLELFPDTSITGRTSPDKCSTFILESLILRSLLNAATLPSTVKGNTKDYVIVSLIGDTFKCRMRKSSVFSSSRARITDATASLSKDEISFRYQMVLLHQLASVPYTIRNHIDPPRNSWTIQSGAVRRAEPRTHIVLGVDVIDLADVAPWQFPHRGTKIKIDPVMLRRALMFAHLSFDRHADPNLSVIEVKNGMARAWSYAGVAFATSEVLDGIDMTVEAADIPMICRMLQRMDARNTTLSTAEGYHFIESGGLEMALQIPQRRLPALIDRIVGRVPDRTLMINAEQSSLRVYAAGIVGDKKAPLEITLEAVSASAIKITAVGKGRFKWELPILQSDLTEHRDAIRAADTDISALEGAADEVHLDARVVGADPVEAAAGTTAVNVSVTEAMAAAEISEPAGMPASQDDNGSAPSETILPSKADALHLIETVSGPIVIEPTPEPFEATVDQNLLQKILGPMLAANHIDIGIVDRKLSVAASLHGLRLTALLLTNAKAVSNKGLSNK